MTQQPVFRFPQITGMFGGSVSSLWELVSVAQDAAIVSLGWLVDSNVAEVGVLWSLRR